MSKTIKVIDLLNMIAKGEIKEGQRFNIKFGDMYRECYFTTDEDKEYHGGLDFFKNCSDNYSVYDFLTLNEEVELLEEQPEIDIQGIEELEKDFAYYETNDIGIVMEKVLSKAELELANKINELVKAVKQIDNKINNK